LGSETGSNPRQFAPRTTAGGEQRGQRASAVPPRAGHAMSRHNRALLCIAAGLLLSAATYQPPV
jgi:hypothetical protein